MKPSVGLDGSDQYSNPRVLKLEPVPWNMSLGTVVRVETACCLMEVSGKRRRRRCRYVQSATTIWICCRDIRSIDVELVGRRVAEEVVVSERRKLAALGDDLASACFAPLCFQDVNLG